jgi:ABC-type antimicrobial peptide transport system permease subunit
MGTSIVMGRDFSGYDTAASPKVMILGETPARRFFGGSDPVGRTVRLDVIGKLGVMETYQVIGVVRDAKYQELGERIRLTAYLASNQDPDPWAQINFELRTAREPGNLIPAVRSMFAEVDRGIALEFRSLESQVEESLLQSRLVALLSSFFGGLALLLAVIGLYGVTAYSVAQRRAEIGIRMALGAPRGSVVLLVLRDVGLMLAAGAVLGLGAALAAGKLVAGMLFGVRPADPATLSLAVFLMVFAGLAAGYLPARRAARLDPTAALRQE